MTDLHHGHHGHHGHHHPQHDIPATVKDPVCGMNVDPTTSRHHAEHGGQTFHFCSARCHDRFIAAPKQYLKPEAKLGAPEHAAHPSPRKGVIYTCPMHPEIRQEGPGSCPICGMALEPITGGVEGEPNPELADMTKRFWVGAALTVPLFLLEMTAHIPGMGLHGIISPHISLWMQFLLATPVVLWAGGPLLERGWRSFVTRRLNMFSLIALGVGAAYLFSLVATFLSDIFPVGFRNAEGLVAVYYEAAAVITVLVLLGQVLELRARERTGGAIKALLNLAPKTARRIRDSADDEEVSLDQGDCQKNEGGVLGKL
jgi:Cu+-exporting ATPase